MGDPDATDVLAESRNNLLHTGFTLLDVAGWLVHIPLSNIRPFASENPLIAESQPMRYCEVKADAMSEEK